MDRARQKTAIRKRGNEKEKDHSNVLQNVRMMRSKERVKKKGEGWAIFACRIVFQTPYPRPLHQLGEFPKDQNLWDDARHECAVNNNNSE